MMFRSTPTFIEPFIKYSDTTILNRDQSTHEAHLSNYNEKSLHSKPPEKQTSQKRPSEKLYGHILEIKQQDGGSSLKKNNQTRYPFIQIDTPLELIISKSIKQLKKQLSRKEPMIKSSEKSSLYEKYHYRDIYKKIDTDIEAFFHQREYNLENFNFLISLMTEQKKFGQIEEVTLRFM